jgi:hypothetical protein
MKDPPSELVEGGLEKKMLKVESTTIRVPGEKLAETSSLLLQVTQGDYKGTLSCLGP